MKLEVKEETHRVRTVATAELTRLNAMEGIILRAMCIGVAALCIRVYGCLSRRRRGNLGIYGGRRDTPWARHDGGDGDNGWTTREEMMV